MPYPAASLREAYAACHPDMPLEDVNDPRYVDLTEVRGGESLVNTIARAIEWCEEGGFHQQLVTGHPGCGKSTELYRLKARLEDHRYFVVHLDVGELLDLGDLSYLDVLVSIARAVVGELEAAGIPLNEKLLAELLAWFSDKIVVEERKTDLEMKTTATAGVGNPNPFAKLLAEVTAQIKSGSHRRTEIRQKLERELSVFIDRLNILIDDARVNLRRQEYVDLVILVDQLEKIIYRPNADGESNHTELFVHHAGQLKSPRCHIVYTVPISLVLSANLGDVFAAGKPFVIPMVNSHNPAGHAKLQEVVARRIDIAQVFEAADLVDRLIDLSGGAMRDLMRLVRLACMGAETRITAKDVDRAERNLVMEYDRLVERSDLDLLREVHKYRRVDRGFAKLLRLRIVHEYQNGERWADLHPAVRKISWIAKELSAIRMEP